MGKSQDEEGRKMRVLRHIVMWKFLPEAEGKSREENMKIVEERLKSLVGIVPTLLKLEIGIDECHTQASYDMALICTHHDVQGMKAYREHPAHVEVMKYIHKVISDRVTSDIFVEDESIED